jgi:hypothetical protein
LNLGTDEWWQVLWKWVEESTMRLSNTRHRFAVDLEQQISSGHAFESRKYFLLEIVSEKLQL